MPNDTIARIHWLQHRGTDIFTARDLVRKLPEDLLGLLDEIMEYTTPHHIRDEYAAWQDLAVEWLRTHKKEANHE